MLINMIVETQRHLPRQLVRVIGRAESRYEMEEKLLVQHDGLFYSTAVKVHIVGLNALLRFY